MAITVNQLMHVNTSVFGNEYVPVPTRAVEQDTGKYNEVDIISPITDFEQLYSVDNQNYSSIYSGNIVTKVPDSSVNITTRAFSYTYFENPFKLPKEALKEFNNYNTTLDTAISNLLVESSVEKNGKKYGEGLWVSNAVVKSLFNPFLTLNVKGIVDNLPLLNDFSKDEIYADVDLNMSYASSYISYLDKTDILSTHRYNNTDTYDTSDCSIKTLVRLSNEKATNSKYSKMGAARYKYADFMYCKDLGKVSNNLLITLRKFPHPIGDNIFSVIGTEYMNTQDKDASDYEDFSNAMDIGRLVAWLGEENKLEDIIKYSFKESWKDYKGQFWEHNSQEDDIARGPLGSIVNLANPAYRNAVAKGIAGSGNTILGRLAGDSRIGTIGLLSNNGTYETNPVVRGEFYDKNKVYEPKGTIRDTKIYEGLMTFNHDFSLTFNYELRAYENINPKSAFLDLLGNILKVTYRDGNWWGGKNVIFGAPRNQAGWDKAMGLIDKGQAGAKDFVTQVFSGNFDFNSFFGKLGNAFKGFLDTSINGIVDTVTGNLSEDKKDKVIKGANEAIDVMGGMFRNAMGRPAIYAMQSILDGSPVGFWHVTIGNPRNPIISMGNLIIDNASIQQYGPLGIDDFPTGIKVVVSLKHAKSRDASEIANMYTKGISMIHIKPQTLSFENYYKNRDEWFKLFGTEDIKRINLGFSN